VGPAFQGRQVGEVDAPARAPIDGERGRAQGDSHGPRSLTAMAHRAVSGAEVETQLGRPGRNPARTAVPGKDGWARNEERDPLGFLLFFFYLHLSFSSFSFLSPFIFEFYTFF
jgi:hypothetical protein